ncbi:YafY family transcriptional regulator [Shewanella sp. D64]|uniref:helix-turn-helix transcriptional regulator n=1 Tax=unclassified Shewanella TaxID=196818 RepID=UPI0022BA66E2|nr:MULTISPECIES: YafY family protein [unclassified Shewanella]MEC4728950.1 YafY family transcriptional regulator [Shewanella sp. D64]MEC4738500.1 YafY family transcriptional regulator [Shewanella sp. E94]WBJ93720.1 YafY family transcriptional regulator [Shewanella sp. MTB7]
MRRADRLFQLVQILRHRRLTTAKELAERLEVSTRTVYRDVQDLCLNGIPIEGEAGVGYLLRQEVNVPPLMFNEVELEAIQVGMRMVQAWGGKELSSAAKQAMIKVEAVLPARLKEYQSLMFAPDFYIDNDEFKFLDQLRKASRLREYLLMDYRDVKDDSSQREVRPLAIYFWKGTWTLLAWCELRHDFRNFRVDRIIDLNSLGRHFVVSPGEEMQDYIALMEAQYGDC